ncbi:MAG: hypothetical protein M1401_01455 [Chloroflexi bacterium]|nr:hypothetical protein [Chloroflexota bacterium]MCL5107544.1 hypothetical protein [Chloroflexota bacterium]
MSLLRAGQAVRPGRYYDFESGRCVEVTEGTLQFVPEGSSFWRLPAPAAASLAAVAAGAFRMLLPVALLAGVAFALSVQVYRFAGYTWGAALRFVRLYPEPGLSYLTPRARRLRHSWLDELESRVFDSRGGESGERLAELEREVAARRERDR